MLVQNTVLNCVYRHETKNIPQNSKHIRGLKFTDKVLKLFNSVGIILLFKSSHYCLDFKYFFISNLSGIIYRHGYEFGSGFYSKLAVSSIWTERIALL